MDAEEAFSRLAGRVTSSEKWPIKQLEPLEALLANFPWAHGYWIRLGHAEFRVGNTDAAWHAYERGVATIPYNCSLWSSYIRFCMLTNAPQTTTVVDRAITLTGDQFLAHELWDAVLDWQRMQDSVAGVVKTLRRILELTLHQFARYYDFLRRLIETDKVALDILGYPSKKAALGEIHVLLEHEQARVSEAWTYERNLRRQCFHPRPLPAEQRRAWQVSVEKSANRESIYRRWLCVEPLNSSVWLDYLRWLLAEGQPVLAVFRLADKTLPDSCDEVRLYFALWLEWVGNKADARELYSRINTPCGTVWYSQFCERCDPGSGTEILRSKLEDPEHWSWLLLQELAKVDFGCFKKYPPPPGTNPPPEYWQAYLSACPEQAEDIWISAPEGSITNDYLRLLARTDPIKFMEADRTINRKAL